jgi:hypothetical protein
MLEKILIKILPIQLITSFIKNNKLAVFCFIVATLGFIYPILAILYKFNNYRIEDLIFNEFFLISAIISLAVAISLLFLNDTKKYLDTFLLSNQKLGCVFRYKKTSFLLLTLAFLGLLEIFFKFHNGILSIILLFLFTVALFYLFLTTRNISKFISDKGSDIQYISYLGIIATSTISIFIIFECIMNNKLNFNIAGILYSIIFSSQMAVIITLLMFNKFTNNSDPVGIKIFSNTLCIFGTYCTLGSLSVVAFLFSELT